MPSPAKRPSEDRISSRPSGERLKGLIAASEKGDTERLGMLVRGPSFQQCFQTESESEATAAEQPATRQPVGNHTLAVAVQRALAELSESMNELVAASTGQPKQEAAPLAPPPPPPCAPTFLDVSDTIPKDAKSEGCCGAGKDLPQYAAEANFLQILFSWHGTVLPLVLRKPIFYALLAVHVGCLFVNLHLYEYEVSPALISAPISLYVFFIVFYASKCYERFCDMYEHTVGIAATTMCWVALVKLHLADAGKVVQWNAVRHILAASHVHYYVLNGAEGDISEREWSVILRRQLLNPDEQARVSGYRGMKPLLLITWALQELRHQLHPPHVRAEPTHDTGLMQEFTEVAFELRGHCGQLTNMLAQPVPWPYFHLVNVLQVCVLSVLGFAIVGYADWPATLVVHAINCFVFLGLKDLAGVMADPFGDDVIDFKVDEFLRTSYINAVSHIEEERPLSGHQLPSGIAVPTLRTPSSHDGVGTAKVEVVGKPA